MTIIKNYVQYVSYYFSVFEVSSTKDEWKYMAKECKGKWGVYSIFGVMDG